MKLEANEKWTSTSIVKTQKIISQPGQSRCFELRCSRKSEHTLDSHCWLGSMAAFKRNQLPRSLIKRLGIVLTFGWAFSEMKLGMIVTGSIGNWSDGAQFDNILAIVFGKGRLLEIRLRCFIQRWTVPDHEIFLVSHRW